MSNCIHAFCYEDPDFENLKCLDCGAEVEPDEDEPMTWTEDTVLVCDGCNKPMIPNLSTWDEEDGGGCGWSCTTYGCPEFTGDEIETEDLEALGVPYWIAERMAGLANAYAMREIGE